MTYIKRLHVVKAVHPVNLALSTACVFRNRRNSLNKAMYESSKVKKIIFCLGIGFLFTHEMDAMLNNEWRVLPLTSWLSDETGERVFLLAHIPLFAVLTALIGSTGEMIRSWTQVFISAFLVIHGILHVAFMSQEQYKFESIESGLLIFAGTICGVGYLLLNQRPDTEITEQGC